MPGGAHDQRAGAFFDAAAEQRIELRDAARQLRVASRRCRCSAATSRGKTSIPPLLDHVVVVAAAKLHAAVLDDPQPPTLGPVLRVAAARAARTPCAMLWSCRSRSVGRHVVEQQDGALPRREELLERENLPAIAERAAGEQPQLRERVEDDPGRLQPLDVVEDRPGRRRQLDLRRVEHRVLLVGIELRFGRRQLANRDAVERPAVRLGDRRSSSSVSESVT